MVTLTGGAAKAFKKQFIEAPDKPNLAAQASLERGRTMLKEFKKKGYVTIKTSKKLELPYNPSN